MKQGGWEDAMRQAFLMAAEGTPVRAILAGMAAQGIKKPSGRPLSVATLWRHLTDPSYAGIGTSKRTFRMSEPIVSERLFLRAQEQLRSRNRSGGVKQKTNVPTGVGSFDFVSFGGQ